MFRERVGLSQQALADRAGLGISTLKALERERRQRPRPSTLLRVADALGLSDGERDCLFNGERLAQFARQSGLLAISQPRAERFAHTPGRPL
jgi:transcriptional regulator with XRE-family HTH domain